MDLNEDIISEILNGNNRIIAHAISLIENNDNHAKSLLSSIYPSTGKAHRIGITGPPGAGKSSITNALIEILTNEDKSIAVISVDPSSPFSHGAFLGDRVRMMKHHDKKNVFIRSMASRGSSGGLARKSHEVADIFDAAGFDFIIFETVGVGQIELDVMNVTDTVVVVLVPESGDDIQMMKAGLMEIADIFIINKADRMGVNSLYSSLQQTISLINKENNNWKIPIQKTTATKMQGIYELSKLIDNHQTFLNENNEIKIKSNQRYSLAVKKLISELSNKIFWKQKNNNKLKTELLKTVKKRMSPYELAEKLFEKGPQ